MEQPLSPPTPEPQPEVVAPTSIWARMANVVAAPGDVFAEVKASPPATSNWLVPALVFAVVGIVCGFLIMSQDWAQQQLRDLVERNLDEQIKRAGIKPEQAEAQRELGMKIGEISAKVGMIVGPVFGGFAMPFWWALFLWFLGNKALRASMPYMRAVEVAGLAITIAILETVVRTLLAFVVGQVRASPTPALLVKELDLGNRMHGALLAANPFTLWMLAVLAVGLSRLAGTTFARAMTWLVGLWAVYKVLVVGLGLTKFGL